MTAGKAKTTPTNSPLCLATLRTDGFVSLRAGVKGGELTTKHFVIDGDRLLLNLAGQPRGNARVELLNEDGRPIPGYSLNDCESLTTDRIDHSVRWKNRKLLTHLRGKIVQARIQLANADLYSIRCDSN